MTCPECHSARVLPVSSEWACVGCFHRWHRDDVDDEQTNGQGETVLTFPLDGVAADGSPRRIVVTLPPGRKLDSALASELVEAAARAARRKGSPS